MVEYSTGLDAIFSSLADSTRRDLLRRIRSHEQTVSELAIHYDLSFAAVSKHLQVLERAKLVKKRKVGREQRVALSSSALRKVDRFLDQYRKEWNTRLDRLGTFLQDSN